MALDRYISSTIFLIEFLSVVFRKVEGFNPHTPVHPLRLLDPYSVVCLVVVRLANIVSVLCSYFGLSGLPY